MLPTYPRTDPSDWHAHEPREAGSLDPDLQNQAEAIRLANDSEFGLMANISSSNPERASRVARQLQAGRVLINTLNHDPLTPFGGYKQSGIGREGGIYGLKEFLEPKAIILG